MNPLDALIDLRYTEDTLVTLKLGLVWYFPYHVINMCNDIDEQFFEGLIFGTLFPKHPLVLLRFSNKLL